MLSKFVTWTSLRVAHINVPIRKEVLRKHGLLYRGQKFNIVSFTRAGIILVVFLFIAYEGTFVSRRL